MTHALDFVQQTERDRRADALVAHVAALDRHLHVDPAGTLKAAGFDGFGWVTKSAVAATSVDDVQGALAPLTAAFLAGADHRSILGALLAAGALQAGLAEAARIQIGTVTAHRVSEGAIKYVGRVEFDVAGAPEKIFAEIVTRDALRTLNPTTIAGVRLALTAATARATDAFLVEKLLGAGTSTTADPGVLLAAVSGGHPAAPILLGGYADLLGLDAARLRDLRDLGVRILPCAAAAGYLILVDAAGLLLADSGLELTIARHASLALDDGDSPESETISSLWQRNLESLRAERFLRCSPRADAVAYGTVE